MRYACGMLNLRLLVIFLAAVSFAVISGCESQSGRAHFESVDITGAEFGKDFSLTDHNGKQRSLSDFKGRLVVMFFGYTHCPDVCPTTMSEINQALNLLGDDGKRVQVLFVTVDPARDSQKLLSQYIPSFNPDFLGLYGDEAATERVAKDFKVFYQKNKSKDGKSYTMDHSAGTYVFDRNGNIRLFMKYGMGSNSIAKDLKVLLKQ